jgi:hypothetical protein
MSRRLQQRVAIVRDADPPSDLPGHEELVRSDQLVGEHGRDPDVNRGALPEAELEHRSDAEPAELRAGLAQNAAAGGEIGGHAPVRGWEERRVLPRGHLRRLERDHERLRRIVHERPLRRERSREPRVVAPDDDDTVDAGKM